MSNLNLKGIWIPIEILTDEKLSDKEIYGNGQWRHLTKEVMHIIIMHYKI